MKYLPLLGLMACGSTKIELTEAEKALCKEPIENLGDACEQDTAVLDQIRAGFSECLGREVVVLCSKGSFLNTTYVGKMPEGAVE